MNERKICFDRATLDNKILLDDDNYLVMPAVIASEIVHQYPEGWAYKPADELEKAAWTADHRWVKILSHPDTALLQQASDIYGIVENPKYVKDLMDPKTKRPCRKGIRADIRWFKNKVPTDIIEKIKSGDLRNVSIGFTYETDATKGEFQGINYDFVQRNIFIDHVAAPIEEGRCPGPLCGIAVDSVVRKVAGDPWEDTEDYIRSGHKEPSDNCRTIDISESEGIKAIYCKYGDKWDIQSYLFSKAKEWTMEKAKNWFSSHKDKGADELIAMGKCGVCREIEKVGLLESAKRLVKAYGKDVVTIIRGEEIKHEEVKEQKQSQEEILLEARKVIEVAAKQLAEKEKSWIQQ